MQKRRIKSLTAYKRSTGNCPDLKREEKGVRPRLTPNKEVLRNIQTGQSASGM
ncbi:hypothetical protein CLOHYLEM_05885 [[Clostridium] hylemonae DSM 15053]|uniref:Uncharacterized protein n=1 Tax=[Clostridium] hylemonae DSM 15053 TaxID=553973 RepID=C0C166_9FIRM|nr:hypothetical protein CLOHYLEM_05885 [[Clostridium] hylemonae DSM 15053]